MGGAQPMLSSLPLQVLLFFSGPYCALYVLLSLAEFVYKGSRLPYPQGVLGLEVFGVLMVGLIEPCRLLLASRGNKTEAAGPIALNLGLSLPLLGAYVYYLRFQAFVLRLDQVLNVGAIVLLGAEWLLGFAAVLVFWQSRRARA